MRVAVACDWFLKYTADLSAGLARQGAEVTLLCRSHAHEFGEDPDERQKTLELATRAGVSVLETPGRLWDPRAAPALRAIRSELTRFSPDVIHAQEGVDPRALALLPRRPTVLTIHDPELHPGQPKHAARKRWFLLAARELWRRRASVIVVHSEPLRALAPLRGSQRSAAIPIGMDVLEQPLRPPAEPSIGFFGRLSAYKGLDVLGRAMPRVWSVRPDVRLRIVGVGDADLGVDDGRIRLERRYLPESEIPEFFAGSSLAVLPYTQASQTAVGPLAIGRGVPVVASRVGGLPDLALDPSYVCTPGDDAELAAAIIAHVDDDESVRKRVLEQLAAPRSWDAVARRTLELYDSVLRTR